MRILDNKGISVSYIELIVTLKLLKIGTCLYSLGSDYMESFPTVPNLGLTNKKNLACISLIFKNIMLPFIL